MDAYVDDLSDAENMPGFGIPSLDHALGGLPWGSLVTIMGFIGFGKSTLALQLALEEAWHRHRGAAIFCGEMPRMELEAKLLELYTGSVVRVTPSAVRQDPERTKALAREGMEAILRFNLAVQGSEVPFTYGGITRDIRHLHRTRGIRLFVVDAFGNLATGEREDVLELKSAAYGLRSLAGQLGAVIATTSQVTAGRGGETWTQWATELDAQSHITLRLAGADDTQTIEEQRAQKRVKLIVRKVRRGDATGRKFTLTREGGRMVEVDWVDREPPPPAPRRKEREDARYGV
jgi:RecA/RadA recombinase